MAKTYITTKGQTIANPRGGSALVPGGQGAPAVVAAPIEPAGAGGPSRATIDDVLECLDIAGEILEQYEREGDEDAPNPPGGPGDHKEEGDEPRHTPSKTVQDVKEDAPPPAPSKGKSEPAPVDPQNQPQPTPPKRGFRHLAARGLFG